MPIEFRGLDDVLARFNDLANIKAEAALGKACALVEGEARKKAPKGRTGDLAKFITSRIDSKGDVLEGVVYSPLEYAPYVEYGTGLFAENGGRTDVPWAYIDEKTGELIWTSGQNPQPFLRPALHEQREKVLEILRGAIKDD